MCIHEAQPAISHLDTGSIIENRLEPRDSDIYFLLLGMSWKLVFCLDVQTSVSLRVSSVANTLVNIEDSYRSPQEMCGLTESRLDEMFTDRFQSLSDGSVARRLKQIQSLFISRCGFLELSHLCISQRQSSSYCFNYFYKAKLKWNHL